jgi:hypothetical protein
MKVVQYVRHVGSRELSPEQAQTGLQAQLALVFGNGDSLSEPATWQELHELFPNARIVACTTAGQIAAARVFDDGIVATAVHFNTTKVNVQAVAIPEAVDSEALGASLASLLTAEDLVHVFVISEGLAINGSALVAGMTKVLPTHVAVTGGLSADGARFERTMVCLDGPEPAKQIVGIGLYGQGLRVGYGSVGGWDAFGPERLVTKSEGNVLYELDGEPALDLYIKYLGDQAARLPSSGLFFPLAIRSAQGCGAAVVRTILGVDEVARTLTFAGDVPLGCRARLMRANTGRLVDGACEAGCTSMAGLQGEQAELALLISCVGRKLVLKQRTEEEVEAVQEVVGSEAMLAGFYSYGEIAPFVRGARSELHNQTMTVTTLSER